MSFQLKARESLSDGIRRNVRNQIEKALEHLGAKAAPHQESAQTETIGEVRKCFKRIRAALRVVREALGDERYHEENWCFRDAARPLTQVRDAGILVETVDKLRHQFPKAIPSATFVKIREALIANRDEVTHRVLDEGKAFAQVRDVAMRALARLPDWTLERDGRTALEAGVKRVYGVGHRALARAEEVSSVANLHEWRKQTKYLGHQLQLVEPALTGVDKGLVGKTHQLSSLLGEDHDLAVLRETLGADPLAYGGHRILKDVFVLIDRQRQDLERQAFALGREIYENSPQLFASRIAASMRHGGLNEESQQTGKAAETAEPRPAVEASHGHREEPVPRKRRR